MNGYNSKNEANSINGHSYYQKDEWNKDDEMNNNGDNFNAECGPGATKPDSSDLNLNESYSQSQNCQHGQLHPTLP